MNSLKTLLFLTTIFLDSTVSAIAAPTDFCSTALYHINIHRQNHSAAAVTWDQATANTASAAISACQAGVGDLSGGNSAKFLGTGNNPYNAAEATALAINAWYNEVSEYSVLTDGFSVAPDVNGANFDSTLHFTQMVWKTQTSVGCFAQACGADTPLTESFNSASQTWNWSWNVFCDFNPGKFCLVFWCLSSEVHRSLVAY